VRVALAARAALAALAARAVRLVPEVTAAACDVRLGSKYAAFLATIRVPVEASA
jgi:hypothetical protein